MCWQTSAANIGRLWEPKQWITWKLGQCVIHSACCNVNITCDVRQESYAWYGQTNNIAIIMTDITIVILLTIMTMWHLTKQTYFLTSREKDKKHDSRWLLCCFVLTIDTFLTNCAAPYARVKSQTEWFSKSLPALLMFHLPVSLFTDNKEYDAYLSYTKVDLDSLGRSVTLYICVLSSSANNTSCCTHSRQWQQLVKHELNSIVCCNIKGSLWLNVDSNNFHWKKLVWLW